MILINPFTRQVLNANPKGCNQENFKKLMEELKGQT